MIPNGQVACIHNRNFSCRTPARDEPLHGSTLVNSSMEGSVASETVSLFPVEEEAETKSQGQDPSEVSSEAWATQQTRTTRQELQIDIDLSNSTKLVRSIVVTENSARMQLIAEKELDSLTRVGFVSQAFRSTIV